MMLRRIKLIAYLEWLTAAGIITYWFAFLFIGVAPENPPEGYLAYERSFPLPDMLLAITLIGSGFLIIYRNPVGKSLALSCAGALIFLGFLDFSFNTQNGIYVMSLQDLVLNVFLNGWCVFFGILMFTTLTEGWDSLS